MIDIIINNIQIKLEFKDISEKQIKWIMQQIHESLDPLDPNRYRNRAYNLRDKFGNRMWDGRVKLIDMKKHLVPTGLYDDLMEVMQDLSDQGYEYSIKDNRGSEFNVKVPSQIILDGNGLEKDLKLRDYQQQSVELAMKEQLGIILVATNGGKCLEKSTELYTDKGIITIGKLLETYGVNTKDTTPRVINYHGEIKLTNRKGELERPSKLVVNGVKSIYEIQTEIGNSIKITGNNPILVVNDKGFTWKRVDELEIGDLLVSRLGGNSYGDNSKFSKVDAYGLGLMVADGYYHNAVINFTNNERVLINYVDNWFYKLTGIRPKVSDKLVNGRYSASEVYLRTGINFDHNNRSLKKEFKSKLELGNHLAGTKEVPNSILTSPKEIQLAFLSGYFECEMNYNMAGGRLGVEITSKSKKLISQVQLMLINMGILSKIRSRKVKGYTNTYYVLVFRAIDGFSLLNLLSFKTNNRQVQKENYINLFKSKHRNPKGRFVPNGKQLFHEYYKTLSLDNRAKAHHSGNIPHTISKYRAIRLLNKFPDGNLAIKDKILKMADLKDCFVKVKSVKKIGNEPTFDVEMPKTHSLVANGLVVHNSSVAIATYKYLLPKLHNDEKLLFIAPNSSIMNQLYTKFQHYLGANYIGVWGDGQKDLSRPIICATIQTLASAIKKPKTKLTKKHDRLIERLATKYGPAILETGSPKANLRLLAMNFKPKYKYEADDVDTLRDLSVNLDNDKAVTEVFKGYQKQYKKLLYKRNEQGFKKYEEAVEFLSKVRAVFVDEAHYAGSDSYWKVFQYLTNARMRIGMTGTLDKSQKVKMQKIKALLGTPIERISNDQMIKRGVSAKPHIKMVPVDQPQDLDIQIGAEARKIGVAGNSMNGDLLNYQIAYRLGVIQNEYRNKLIAQLAYKASQQLHKQAVLIIVNSIEHGELINKELDKLHANYAFLQGKDDTEIRQKAFQDVRDGKLSILVGTKILDAGIDIPNLKVLIVCSAGKSYISLLQRIGRILRIMPDKRDVYIFDLFDRTTSYLYSHAKKRVKYYKEEGFDVS